MARVSHTVSKLGQHVGAIGLPAGVTCRENAPCLPDCYACKGRFRCQNVKASLQANLDEYKLHPVKFEADITKKSMWLKYVRWFHSGDIVDYNFLLMMRRIAAAVRDTRNLAFTKKFELVNRSIDEHGFPTDNLTLVLSAWGDDFMPDNPYNLPVAYIRLKDKSKSCHIPSYAMECMSSCEECITKCNGGCWNLKRGEAVVFNQH